MEIITMESSAYRELIEKIDKIAGYVRENERAKKKDTADVWLDNKEVMGLLGGQPPHTATATRKRTYRVCHLSGSVPLPVLGSGTTGKGKRGEL